MNYQVAYTYMSPDTTAGDAAQKFSIYGFKQIHHRVGKNLLFTNDGSPMMYIGTFFSLNQSTTSTTYQAGFAVQPIYRSEYKQGTTGCARIMLWNNVSPGQNLQVTGILRTQLVATGAVAPYSETYNTVGSLNSNMIPFVAALFNGPSVVYKRVFSGDEYENIKRGLRRAPEVVYHQSVMSLGPNTTREVSASGLTVPR